MVNAQSRCFFLGEAIPFFSLRTYHIFIVELVVFVQVRVEVLLLVLVQCALGGLERRGRGADAVRASLLGQLLFLLLALGLLLLGLLLGRLAKVLAAGHVVRVHHDVFFVAAFAAIVLAVLVVVALLAFVAFVVLVGLLLLLLCSFFLLSIFLFAALRGLGFIVVAVLVVGSVDIVVEHGLDVLVIAVVLVAEHALHLLVIVLGVELGLQINLIETNG